MDNPIILSQEEIEEQLKILPGWTYQNDKISKEFQFKNFISALGFINQMAFFFEKIDHHADMHIYYKKIVFDLQRFDVGGKVTDRDFLVAREIERLYGEWQK
ncbi:MAG: 4a-hydroxytetrahydrobiopterin dehydratase [Patescibacteria group bacterium]